jgi:hypothetical protein
VVQLQPNKDFGSAAAKQGLCSQTRTNKDFAAKQGLCSQTRTLQPNKDCGSAAAKQGLLTCKFAECTAQPLTVTLTPLTTTMPRVGMTFSTSATVPLSLPETTWQQQQQQQQQQQRYPIRGYEAMECVGLAFST